MPAIDATSGSHAVDPPYPAGRRVLITGAAGFFGLALTRAFALSGWEVLAIDVVAAESFRPRSNTPPERVSYRQVDVSDRHATAGIANAQVDMVVHAAALTPTTVQQLEEPERIVDANLGGTLNM